MARKSKSTFGIGVIGAGSMGRIHAQCFAADKGCTIAAVFNPTRSKAEELAKAYGAAVEDTAEALIKRDDVQIVSIASPQTVHCEQILAAAAAGKHIFCEKPLALTIEELDAVEAAVKKAGVTLMVGHQMRFHPVILAVKQAMKRVGPVFAIDFEWAFRIGGATGRCWETYRLGGFFMELGCHAADLARFLGGPIQHVSAHTLRMNHERITEDYTHSLLKFDSEAIGSIIVSANHRNQLQGLLRARVLGEKGRIDFTCYPYGREMNEATITFDRGKSVFVADTTTEKLPLKAGRAMYGDFPGFYDIYHQEVANYLKAIRTGSEPACTLADGRSAVEVVLAIYDQQHRATSQPNFTGAKRDFVSDASSHPALKR